MTKSERQKLEEAYERAAVAYTIAADAFEVATESWKASVMAYDVATGANEGAMFDPPESGSK
jgi:hypothetical protein